ncbi:MAG: esterase/lipase family protein, partial [Propylenella sp.]
MPRQVVILHGWSDTSESFHDLRVFLGNNGFEVTEVWLGDYISKDDDVRIPDVAKRMQAVLSEMLATGKLKAPFDVIVHSTGGLVVREWVARYFPNGAECPVKRIVMLAPANFGSRLAAAGKSFVGRVAKGFDNWFQTGTEML